MSFLVKNSFNKGNRMRSKISVTLAISTATLALGFSGLTARTALADAGTYSVPVSADLRPYATFPIDVSYSKTETQLSIQYNLPETLTGVPNQTISLQGAIPQASGNAPIALSGPQTTASCTSSGVSMTCHVAMQSVKTDFGRLQSVLQGLGTAPDEIDSRLEVAKEFSTGPVGIVTYSY
jgi:hypothetical protein